MKDEGYIVILLCFLCTLAGFILGYEYHPLSPCPKCPPCIEQVLAACPPEDIYVNTAAGIMQFEKGEIDARPPYIINQQQMDEMYQKLEQEILKQKGNAS